MTGGQGPREQEENAEKRQPTVLVQAVSGEQNASARSRDREGTRGPTPTDAKGGKPDRYRNREN